jgi:type II secretory pathway component GspD/PulD (secretin)
MMVQYSVQISELTQLKSFGEGNNAIQLPEISTTSFEQQAVLENGQTLILAGFERDRATVGDDAMATVGGLPVGGAKTAETSRVATVMMITPRLINRRDSISSGR